MGYGFLNIGSLAFGLMAWILPIAVFVTRRQIGHRLWAAMTITSISACGVSLCFQIFYSSHLVAIKDWSALMDTINAVAWVSGLLLAVTVILNVISTAIHLKKQS